MATVEYIEKDGRRTFAIVPMTLWRKAMMALGSVDDGKVPEAPSDESERAPAAVRQRAAECGSAVLAWREHRGLTQSQLAGRAGISKAYLSQIETGARHGSVRSLKALAVALGVPLDVLTR